MKIINKIKNTLTCMLINYFLIKIDKKTYFFNYIKIYIWEGISFTFDSYPY